MTRLEKINEFLHQKGVDKEITLVKGKDYFYFTGGITSTWYQTGVYVKDSFQLSFVEWLNEYRQLSGVFEKREEEIMDEMDKKIDLLEESAGKDQMFTMKAKNKEGKDKMLLCIKNEQNDILPIAEMIEGNPYEQYTF